MKISILLSFLFICVSLNGGFDRSSLSRCDLRTEVIGAERIEELTQAGKVIVHVSGLVSQEKQETSVEFDVSIEHGDLRDLLQLTLAHFELKRGLDLDQPYIGIEDYPSAWFRMFTRNSISGSRFRPYVQADSHKKEYERILNTRVQPGDILLMDLMCGELCY